MEPVQFYQSRLEELNAQLKRLKQRKSSFAWLRLGAIIAIFAGIYILWSFGIFYAISAVIILLIIFVRLVYADLRNQSEIDHTSRLIHINEDELKWLSGNFLDFDLGIEHVPKEHPYCNDLDIFGRASVFQYFNRTTSEPGSKRLAEYLLSPARVAEIEKRQKAVKELSSKALWIQEFRAHGKKNRITFATIDRLKYWMKEPPVFSGFTQWKWLRYVLPLIIISIVSLYILNLVGDTIFYLGLLVFAAIAYQINKYVAPIHEQLSKVSDELSTLFNGLSLIEKENFESPLLKELQSVFLVENKKASSDILRVKKMLDRLDLRYNIAIPAPLNILLLWNLQQVLDLETWKHNRKEQFGPWFQALAEFEALNSLGIVSFNRPQWIFPPVEDSYFFIKGKNIGHPLIPESRRIDNDIDIDDRGKIMLVTGSNMAGKSTYLRSIGVNLVLAMAGSSVCASEFKVSHLQLISSMRITDNLEESTSTFYAELKKLKTIIEKVNSGERVFILLDEILRGTNSLDRHTGSRALIKQLIHRKAPAIIATHDLELAELKDEFPQNILNYHFDVQVSNEELFFDYLLKPGICNSLNASILMKKIGINL